MNIWFLTTNQNEKVQWPHYDGINANFLSDMFHLIDPKHLSNNVPLNAPNFYDVSTCTAPRDQPTHKRTFLILRYQFSERNVNTKLRIRYWLTFCNHLLHSQFHISNFNKLTNKIIITATISASWAKIAHGGFKDAHFGI